jgi:hypothetical protein
MQAVRKQIPHAGLPFCPGRVIHHSEQKALIVSELVNDDKESKNPDSLFLGGIAMIQTGPAQSENNHHNEALP